jgi:hypothetical protein
MSNGDFTEMSEAVPNAGPFIHLAELEALDTLRDFSALFVSNSGNQNYQIAKELF